MDSSFLVLYSSDLQFWRGLWVLSWSRILRMWLLIPKTLSAQLMLLVLKCPLFVSLSCVQESSFCRWSNLCITNCTYSRKHLAVSSSAVVAKIFVFTDFYYNDFSHSCCSSVCLRKLCMYAACWHGLGLRAFCFHSICRNAILLELSGL